MDEITQEKEITKLEKYLVKEGRQDFIDSMRSASAQSLDAKLLGLAKHVEEIKNTEDADEKYQESKLTTKVLGAPYREQRRMNKKMTRFIALLMKEQGIQ